MSNRSCGDSRHWSTFLSFYPKEGFKGEAERLKDNKKVFIYFDEKFLDDAQALGEEMHWEFSRSRNSIDIPSAF